MLLNQNNGRQLINQSIVRRSSVNFEGGDIFAGKICMTKINKMPEFYMMLVGKNL